MSDSYKTGVPCVNTLTCMNLPLGQVFRPGEPEYDDERLGLNRAVESCPEYVVGAASEHDVVAAVRMAVAEERAVGVMATGHSPTVAADGAVLINTGRMNGVEVNPQARTAWVEAGTRWRQVVERAGAHGLAPLNGSSPNVGAVGYTTGGGAGLLGRRFGFAADHVRRLRMVTADGRLREVGPDSDPDLFWAVRGGKDNFGVVVGMEVELFPVARLYGGGLYFPAEATGDVLHAYTEWTRSLPEHMASSVLLAQNPDLPAVPEPLRGRFVTHVRIAFSGAEGGEELVRPLREIGPTLMDTVRDMPYTEVGTIHHEPTDAPYVAYDRNVFLHDIDKDAADTLLAHAGPDAQPPFITELRHFGGAYARPPEVPNCVGGRDATFCLFTGATLTEATPALESRDRLLMDLRPWSTGGTNINFAGVEDTAPDIVRTAYRPADYTRLTELKAVHDPGNVFRINFNIPPKGTPE
ncbi:FAD-binding oxidoreductase [Actinomadura sp. NEAU-AAG7]|uniref:FAD-binding oxidoreductase n=1 Tax=Actinomadura sp. NEAU-AAG7 TaxID=2839640 RepID=UPI001BE41EEE|nr:FAD-binding oxidoreductase [Actinomadura sp. NEAU-AAG7]MBT2207265.1 FAD-binding oxidoreductase [Actinomadura sp. NEAU-AAG7]